MIRSSSEVPIFDHFLLPGEVRDPDRRFAKSIHILVFFSSSFLELLLSLASLALGSLTAALVHGVLVLGFLVPTAFFRHRFHPPTYALIFWALAWTSALVSLGFHLGVAALLWHFFLPVGVLLLRGERWGWITLAADLGFSVVQIAWFSASFGILVGMAPSGIPVLVGWQVCAFLLFAIVLFFVRMTRSTVDFYQSERGQALDQLSLTKDSEARWADQARFLETLMDLIPFPLFHKGVDGRYISTNASFRVVFDVQKEAVTGQRSEDFLLPENAKTLAKIELDLLARDSMAVEETVLIHADGHPHDFVVYLMPFVDGSQSLLGSIGVFIDITDRKLREGKLEQLNATKDQLFSIISHDLRGPVGKLKQLLDIYIDDPSIFDKATWDQVFHDMRRSADSLFQLLENLLSWARSQQGQGQVRYESVALEPLVGDVFAVLKLLAGDKRIGLEMDLQIGGPVLTDRHVLSTIVRNLVHNALKFTPPGGKITVTAQETPDDLWIEVKDTGVGMTEDVVHRIFRKGERLSTYGTGKERGQGIGLGLCRDLAEVLGAHFQVESQVGSGTTIRLHLPTPEL